MLRMIRSTITEHSALTMLKTMLPPDLEMGNLFMSSQTMANQGNLEVILNIALRVVYHIYKPCDVIIWTCIVEPICLASNIAETISCFD